MWNCSACKQAHSDMRERCPSTGHPRPKRMASEAIDVCDACQRNCKTSVRCDTCDGIFHPRCYKTHARTCADHAEMLDFQEWVSDHES